MKKIRASLSLIVLIFSTSLNSFGQEEIKQDVQYKPAYAWKQDSIIIIIYSLRTAPQDVGRIPKKILERYIEIKNDTLFVNFPENFEITYHQDFINRKSPSQRATIWIETREGNQIVTKLFYQYLIAGKRTPLLKTNEKFAKLHFSL